MRPMDDIEKRISSVPVNTNAERDKQVLGDVLNALEESRKAQSAACQPIVWRTIMKNNITRLAAGIVLIAALLGIYRLDEARAAFARTTKVVSTGLAGLKEFIRDMRTREAQPPSAVVPVQPSGQPPDVQGRYITAKVRVFSADAGQENLQDFFEREGIKLAPAGDSPNTSYTKLGPEKTERFIELMGRTKGIECLSSPIVMLREGQEGLIGIAGAEGQDATALALVATVPDEGDSLDLSFSFLRGQSGFEIPSLRIGIDDAVLFRLVTTDKQHDQNGPGGQDCILVLVKTKVFSQT